MVRRLYGFSVHENGSGVSTARFVIALLMAWAGAFGPTVANGADPLPGSPAPIASPALDPTFLNLPAYDLELAKRPADQVRVGDRLQLKISGLSKEGNPTTMKVPAGTPPLNDEGWELLAGTPGNGNPPIPAAVASPEPLKLEASEKTEDFSFTAVPIKPGKLALPSLLIQDPAGNGIARTNPFTVEVASAIAQDDPKPDQPVDLKPPVGVMFPWWLIAVASLILLALLGLGIFALVRWSQKKRAGKVVKPVEPPKPEDEQALESLAGLQRAGLVAKGQYKAHYFGVSEILKRYIGARYRFDASESTAREIISILEERKSLDDRLVDQIEALFDQLDVVKFTDHVPSVEDGKAVLEEAKRTVLETRRRPMPGVVKTASEVPNAV